MRCALALTLARLSFGIGWQKVIAVALPLAMACKDERCVFLTGPFE
jgi:hypothetical protein